MPGGRPLKNGVDYFPLDVILDDKFELIEAEHGIQGFGVLIKIYQKIYASNYWIKFDKKAILVFSNRINVDINSINAIINSCIEWDIFDPKLFKSFEVLTSAGIQKRYFEIVKRRNVVEVCKDFLLIEVDVNVYKNLINVDHNSQRKGKGKEKEKTTIGEFKKPSFIPENYSIQENHIQYGLSKKLNKEQAKDQFEAFIIYHKANGKKFKSWYAAFQNWIRKSIEFGNVKINNNQNNHIPTQEEIDTQNARFLE